MYNFNYLHKLSIVLAIVFSANLTYSSKSINTPLPEKSFSELTSIYPEQQITNNAQTFKQLTQALAQSTKQQDTAKVIKTLIDLGDIERFRGNFEASFDYLWTALLYAEESKNNIVITSYSIHYTKLYDRACVNCLKVCALLVICCSG